MGLLSLIEGDFQSPSKTVKSEGLLAKSQKMMEAGKVDFSAFIKNNCISKAAVFSLSGFTYYISQSCGLDFDSFSLSKSTKDFWDGLISSKNTWYDFYTLDHSINTLLQLFSTKIKENVNEINVCKNKDSILLVLKENEEHLEMDNILESFKTVSLEKEEYIPPYVEITNPEKTSFTIDFSNLFKLLSITLSFSEDTFSFVRQNMKNETLRMLSNILPDNAVFHFEENKCCFDVYTKQKLSRELFVAHFKKSTQEFFGKSASELIIN